MGILNLVLALGLLSGAPEQAPPSLFNFTLHTEMRHDEKPGGRSSGGAWPLVKGQSLRMRTYAVTDGCGFAAGAREFDTNSPIGWQVDVMPVEITADHAVMRVHWSREVELGRKTGKAFHEAVVLLRPGDSLPLDTYVLPDVNRFCTKPVGVLVAGLEAREPERVRVASTDLWLVHRDPAGKETTQHINVRGNLNTSIPFFFDEERAGPAVLDVFGRFTLRPKTGDTLALEFNAQRFLAGEPYGVNASHFGSGRMVTEIGPDSVTSFEIPLSSGPGWKAFAGHSLSVRVKSRRMR